MEFEQLVVRLEWECTNCGELAESPHDPCPHCGTTEFDRLSDPTEGPDPLEDDVRLKSSAEEQQLIDNFVWECTNCEKRHMRNSPPCTRCGNTQLEKVPVAPATEIENDSGSGLSLGLFEHTSAIRSLIGLALAVVGGVLIMGGGLLGTVLSQTPQQMSSTAWMIVLVGVTIGAVGAGVVLFDTRLRDSTL